MNDTCTDSGVMELAQFKYAAKTMDGKTVSGVLEADSISRVQQILKSSQQFALKIQEVGAGSAQIGKSANLKDLTVFCRQFHSMLTSGVTVVKCLDLLYQQTDKKSLKDVIFHVYDSVQRGDLLSSAMRKRADAFPELMISMVETGEASGTLDTIMGKLADNFERDLAIRRKIQSAMIYPIVITILAVIVVTGLIVFVMPMFIDMFESSGTELPGPTKFLLAFSKFLRGYWYIVIFVLLASFFGFQSYIGSDKGRLVWDQFKLKIPVVKGTLLKIYAVRLTRTLTTLVSAGLPLISAIDIASRVIGNKYVSNHLDKAKADVQSGIPLSSALRKTGVFPPMVHAMIGIGEEAGSLDSMLDNTARYFDDEAEKALKNMVSLLEPMLIIVMAVVVGFIVISIMLPIFDMTKTVK